MRRSRRLDLRSLGLRQADLRLLAAALTLAAPAAGAQEARLFQNSWFWGVHAGATIVGTDYTSGSSAGTVGAEWLITRSVAGLYVAYDQASFSQTAAVYDPNTTNGIRPVSIHDMRTGSVAGVAFPVQIGHFRPYAGLGFAISVIGSATPQTVAGQSGGGTVPADATVQQRIEDARSQSTLFAMGGGQWQTKRLALYGQLTLMPASSDFLITRSITQISAGVRYNFGSSIDR